MKIVVGALAAAAQLDGAAGAQLHGAQMRVRAAGIGVTKMVEQAAASPPNSVAVTVNTLQRQHKQQRAHRARGQRKQRSRRLNGSEG